ncbi:hypothetical protein PC111_g3628 [Phytophthora cactorum]|nr:hypothetical protein PC111_g3628 [Phytophthora cactorum]
MSDYAESKMADVQFTYELQRRLLHAGIDKYPVGGSASRSLPHGDLKQIHPHKVCEIRAVAGYVGSAVAAVPASEDQCASDVIQRRLTSGTLKMATEKELCERVCKKQACAIQFCLQRRNYQESKCAEVIKRYYDCCAAAKEAEQKTRTTSS